MSPSVEEDGNREIGWLLRGACRGKLLIGDRDGSSGNWTFGT
jgi:hypothetical protein